MKEVNMPNSKLMNEVKSKTTFNQMQRQRISDLVFNENNDVNAQGDMGYTALMLAIINKNYEVAHYLIVVLHAKLDIVDHHGQIAHDHFLTNEQEDAAIAARNKGATRIDPSSYDLARSYLLNDFKLGDKYKNETVSHEVLFKKLLEYADTGQVDKAVKLQNLEQYINQQDITGKTALMRAIENNNFIFAKWLLVQNGIKSGGDLKDNQGQDTYDYFQKAAGIFKTKTSFVAGEVIAFKEVEKTFILITDTILTATLLERSDITRESRMIERVSPLSSTLSFNNKK